MLCLLLWGVSIPAAAQERAFSVVLPELQYSHHCSSEIELHNTSPRFVDVDVIGRKTTGAIVGLRDRKTNRLRLSPGERVPLRLEVQGEVAWAQIVETVPHPRLQPVLAISGFTECLNGNERLSEPREIASPSQNPHFSLDPASVSGRSGTVLLIINASAAHVSWSACYSAGTEVSNGKGEMTALCSQTLESTLAAYQSCRLATSIDGKPLIRFKARGSAVAMQILTPSALELQLFKVESTIHFDLESIDR